MDDRRYRRQAQSAATDGSSALSLWALVSGHWSAWQAARVEVRQDDEAKRAEEEPVEQRIVDKLVEETTVEPSPGK
jgi:hypothetical protein